MLAEPRFDQIDCSRSIHRQCDRQRCVSLSSLCVHSRLQALQQARFLCFLAFLHQHVEGVEEGVQRGVEGHHEDGHSDVELARDGSSCGSQHTQQADREPAQEENLLKHLETLRYSEPTQDDTSPNISLPVDKATAFGLLKTWLCEQILTPGDILSCSASICNGQKKM